MPKSKHSISVVIPAYNEQDYIESCVVSLEAVLIEVANEFEIIVVDDGSSDKTWEILERLRRSRPYLIALHQDENRGLGRTLRSGFDACQKETVFYSDADLPFDFLELARALRVMEFKGAELVTGFRHDRTHEGFKRIVYSFAYNWLMRLLFGLRIKDVNFSFKLIRRDALRALRLRSDGSFIDAEMMIKADRLGFFVCQIGTDYFKRRYGKSNLSSVATILTIIREMALQFPSLMRLKPISHDALRHSG